MCVIVFDKLREKTDKTLQIWYIISSVALVLSFVGSILFLFFHLLMYLVGHGGEIIWPLVLAIVSLSIFLFSLIFFILTNKIRKERIREIK
ncbi:MAG: hypothetical protein H7641_06185 [Candidatus Heimdallarchaeota archaeon]|nr:hypothetical protein [Candidatus Heimdallarchaeota archaeon]MCK4877150.1 hypothetical protein [Candidatus Heimdallarchaeota archaeon]